MKSRLLALSAFVLAAASAMAEDRDLFLVAGQSNAVGFDAYPQELPADAGDKQVPFWWRCGDPPPDDHDSTSGGQWTHLQPQPRGNPIPKDASPQDAPAEGLRRQYGNFRKAEGGFGPEIGFARELRRHGHRSFAIVKVAFSGSGMRTDWNPEDPGSGGACYRALVRESKTATAAAAEHGIVLHLRALIWVQGESDANAADAPNYEQALRTMFAGLRKELDASALTVFLGVNTHFGNDRNPFMPRIVEAQKSLALHDPHAVYVDTEGAETLLPDRTHFTAAGTLEVGRRFATALLAGESAASAR